MANLDKNKLISVLKHWKMMNCWQYYVLDADISFFLGEADVLDSISPANQEELQQMVNEPFGFETETEAAFKKATEKWRSR
jgi:hypothetical protein